MLSNTFFHFKFIIIGITPTVTRTIIKEKQRLLLRLRAFHYLFMDSKRISQPSEKNFRKFSLLCFRQVISRDNSKLKMMKSYTNHTEFKSLRNSKSLSVCEKFCQQKYYRPTPVSLQ